MDEITLNIIVYDVSINFDARDTKYIVNIHEKVMQKNPIR